LIAPRAADKIAELIKMVKKILLVKHITSKKNGAIFCQVKINVKLNHDKPSIICGTHAWRGAEPNLRRSLNRRILAGGTRSGIKEEPALVNKADIIRIEDASACTKKYFKMASVFRGDLSFKQTTKRASTLISRPIHATNQEEADIVINDPINRIHINNIFQGRNSIKRRIISIVGLWAQKLF
jgi:hypothetical protein